MPGWPEDHGNGNGYRRHPPALSASASTRYISPVSAFFFSARLSRIVCTAPCNGSRHARSWLSRSQNRYRPAITVSYPCVTACFKPSVSPIRLSAKCRASSACAPAFAPLAARRCQRARPWRDRRRRRKSEKPAERRGPRKRGGLVLRELALQPLARLLQRRNACLHALAHMAESRARSRPSPRARSLSARR